MRGYGSYRGRSHGRTVLKALILLLIALLIAALVAFYFLEPYIVYTNDGVRLDLPPIQEGEEPAFPTPSFNLPVVVATPTPEPTPEPIVFRALALPRSALTDGTAAERLAAVGAEAAIFDMKAGDGSLGYVSDLEQARRATASASDPALNEAIRAMTGSDIYTVALVSCFRDDKLPYYENKSALRTSAGNWRGSDGVRWLSPARESAREYVIGVCRELAALGFDEILLTYSAFPTAEEGRLESLIVGEAYPADNLSAVVEDFYGEVRAALADYPATMLSITSTEAVLNGDPADMSGQTIGQLAEYADRVWAPVPVLAVSDYAGALESAGMEDAADRLVLITESLPDGGAGCWAVLAGEE